MTSALSLLVLPRGVLIASNILQAGSGSPTMAASVQDFQRSESERLSEVKGHLEIALLEKHFLQTTA
ncbi:GRAM domain-containing protein 4 [Ataeniobius toweri]|uniref:GRAM domain-containing protein 4 n=1 Tax=Ataeniobius toweri TaxID=208326 RepID=A0ABU7AFP6_9TELE|nr:GRAM domain-containing protein 4 [Ataeniobius toweri]